MRGMQKASKYVVTAITGAALLCLSGTATAQGPGGRGGNRLSPEKVEAAIALEAQSAAKEAGVPAENSAKVAEAYKAYRKALQDAVAAGGGGVELRQVFDTEKTKLKTALTAAAPGQADILMTTLGANTMLSRNWDRMVDLIAGFKLEAGKQDQALSLIAKYIAESDATIAKAGNGGDRQAAFQALAPLKEKLDTDIAGVVSAEQAATWKEATARRGGGGPGAPGGQGGGERRGFGGTRGDERKADSPPPAEPAPAAPATPAAPAAPK